MIILDATTKSLQIKLSASVATNQLPFSASYIDSNGSTTTPGEQDGTTSNPPTTVTIVSSPAASTQRLIKSLTIQNADTAAATVTIIYNNNSTLRNIIVATLAAGDQLIYEDGHGWSAVDKNGNLKTSASGSGGSTSPGGSSGQVQYNNAGAFGGLANGQLPGTTTNDNASAGNVGEFISATGSSTSLTNSTAATLTSISLTAGDWDVQAVAAFSPASATTSNLQTVAVSTVSGTLSGAVGTYTQNSSPIQTGFASGVTSPVVRVSLASTTTVYCVAEAYFAVSTMSATGFIRARRVR
jgi:hypothetical protein